MNRAILAILPAPEPSDTGLVLEELLEDLSEAVALNLLTTEALQCIWPPRFERMPAVWLVDAAILLMSVLLLLSATKRDDDEIKMVEMIIVGRTIERRQRLARTLLWCLRR